MTNLFFHFSLISFRISFYLFFHKRCFFALPISVHSSLIIFDNCSRVNLETTFRKIVILHWNLTIFNSNIESRWSIFLIVTLTNNLTLSSRWFIFLRNLNMNLEAFFSIVRILFQWNNWYCLFLRCGYSATNLSMFYPFVPIIYIY